MKFLETTKNRRMFAGIALIAMLSAFGVTGRAQEEGQGQAVITVLPKHDSELAPSVVNPDMAVKVNGKNSKVTKWAQYPSNGNNLELVVLIDDSARSSLGRQMDDIAQFLKTLPPNTKASVAYMENGRAAFSGPFTTDHAHLVGALHLPVGGAGVDSSPYFCLSDLAHKWPSNDASARREVVMVTNGVDNYQKRFDPDDPYVQAAIKDSTQARMVIYSIYWADRGGFNQTAYANDTGQNLLAEVTQATGGKSFWGGMGNPVSFAPYFDELTRRFRNQYELGFTTGTAKKPEVDSFKLKLSAPGSEVDAPQQILVVPAGPAQQ
jgi:hypothetical protein